MKQAIRYQKLKRKKKEVNHIVQFTEQDLFKNFYFFKFQIDEYIFS